MSDGSSALRAYVQQRPELFMKLDLLVREDHFLAECRCGYRAGPAPVWSHRAEAVDAAASGAAKMALDYWSWMSGTRP